MIQRINPFVRLPGGFVVAAAVALALVVLVGGGCSTYQTRSTVIKQAFEDSNYDHALANIDEIDLG